MEKSNPYIKRLLFTGAVIGMCITSIYCQTEKYLLPAEIKEQTIITEPATLQKGFFRTSIVLSHGFEDKIFDETSKKINLFGSASEQTRSITLAAQYGITDRLQLNLLVPYISNQLRASGIEERPGEGTMVLKQWKQDAKGLGDVELGVYYQVLTEKPDRPSITLRTTFRFNTGKKNPTNVIDEKNFDAPAGTGEPLLAIDAHLRKIIYPYSFTFTTMYYYYFGGNKVMKPGEYPQSFRTGNMIVFMGSANFHVNEWIALVNEIMYFHGAGDEIDGETTISEKWAFIYHPYLYFQIKRFRLVQSVEIPLKGCVYTADPQYILMLQYQF
jgi:hypothetical protein